MKQSRHCLKKQSLFSTPRLFVYLFAKVSSYDAVRPPLYVDFDSSRTAAVVVKDLKRKSKQGIYNIIR